MGLVRRLPVITVALILLLAGDAGADEVRLKNGDRLTGKVITMKDGKLIFETTYAGKITIQWSEVSSLKSDEPITVVLSDETAFEGATEPTEEGKMKLETEKLEEAVSFALVDVKSINPKPEPAVKWTARANFGMKIEGGNTDSEEYHFDGKFVARTKKNRFTAGFEMDRDLADDVRTENNWLAYTKYDHFLTEKWFFNTNASFEKDDFKDISSRTVLGAGAGYQLWEEKLKNLSAELGLAYVAESFTGDTPDDDYLSARWALDFDHYLYKEIIQFFHWDEALFGLEDSSDIFLRTRTGFRFPLYKGLTWTVQYNFDWDHSPAPGLDKVDTKFLLTVGYEGGNQ